MVVAEVLAMLLWCGASFVIVYWLSGTFDWNPLATVGVWLATALIVIWPGSDSLIARFLLGLRRPTMVENQRIAPIWYSVAERAGVDPSRFTVWVEGAETPTGAATGGSTVSVTRWSLYTLPPSHLAAALAHNLAVRRHGHLWVSRVMHWYSVPARLLAFLVWQLVRLSRTIPAIGCTIIGFLLVAYLGLFVGALIFYDSLAMPLLFLAPLFSPLLFIGANKFAERMADHATADHGYGRKFLEVLYGWQAQHEVGQRRGGFAQADWLTGQPSVAERISALEVYLQRR
jgi:Zn-dependent protease with chaperone function